MWHLTIHEYKVKWPVIVACPLERVYRLEAIEICIAFEAELLYETDGDALIDQVVLCYTHTQFVLRYVRQINGGARLRIMAVVFLTGEFRHEIWLARSLLVPGVRLCCFCEADREGHSGSFARYTLQPHIASHDVDYSFANRQSEPGAAVAAGRRRLDLRERKEELLLLFIGNTDACVDDGACYIDPFMALVIHHSADSDRAFGSELVRVGE